MVFANNAKTTPLIPAAELGVIPLMTQKHMSIDKPINSKLAATIIALLAIAIFVIFILETDWSQIELNAYSVLLPLLFVVIIVGFVFIALGNKGRNVTSEETDNKIADNYRRVQQKLLPAWWVLVVCWVVWMGYLLWNLNIKV